MTGRRFDDTVQGRVRSDPAFREAPLREGVQCLLAGGVDAGKPILRDDINATNGFETLGRAVGTPPKSRMRMFGPRGTPGPHPPRRHRPPPAPLRHRPRGRGAAVRGVA
ncbi:MAG: hypothetical protein ACFCUO_11795 [Rhodospirillales bacterium]